MGRLIGLLLRGRSIDFDEMTFVFIHWAVQHRLKCTMPCSRISTGYIIAHLTPSQQQA